MESIAQIVGKRIRSFRLQQGLSQEELAERAGCHPTYVGQLERGEKNATLESVEKISSALKIPLSRLVELSEQRETEENRYAYLCYEIAASQNAANQKRLYEILSAIEKYRQG